MKSVWPVVFGIALASVVVFQLTAGRECAVSAVATGPPPVEKAVPFEAVTLSGEPVRLPDDYTGKLVLLDFWATWCGPCRGEVPHLREAQRSYGDKGLRIVGIALDEERQERTVREFVGMNRMDWDIVLKGAHDIASAYGVQTIPTAYLIDGDTGRIIAHGDALRGAALSKTIEKNLDTRG